MGYSQSSDSVYGICKGKVARTIMISVQIYEHYSSI